MKSSIAVFEKSEEFTLHLEAESEDDKRILAQLDGIIRINFKKNGRKLTLKVGSMGSKILDNSTCSIGFGLKLM